MTEPDARALFEAYGMSLQKWNGEWRATLSLNRSTLEGKAYTPEGAIAKAYGTVIDEEVPSEEWDLLREWGSGLWIWGEWNAAFFDGMVGAEREDLCDAIRAAATKAGLL